MVPMFRGFRAYVEKMLGRQCQGVALIECKFSMRVRVPRNLTGETFAIPRNLTGKTFAIPLCRSEALTIAQRVQPLHMRGLVRKGLNQAILQRTSAGTETASKISLGRTGRKACSSTETDTLLPAGVEQAVRAFSVRIPLFHAEPPDLVANLELIFGRRPQFPHTRAQATWPAAANRPHSAIGTRILVRICTCARTMKSKAKYTSMFTY